MKNRLRVFCCAMVLAVCIGLLAITASAAKYPTVSLVTDLSGGYKVGDTIEITVLYTPAYTNGELELGVYNSSGKYCGGSSAVFAHRNLNPMYYTFTVQTDKDDDPGTYKLVLDRYFYTAGDWWYMQDECVWYYELKASSSSFDPNKDGWQYLDGEWAYFEDGERLRYTWIKDSVGWCYIDGSGYIRRSSWIHDEYIWYYVDYSGHMVTNQWVRWGNDWDGMRM